MCIMLALVLVLTCQYVANGQTIDQVKDLHTTLMTGYNKLIRPVNNQLHPLNVLTNISLISLVDFDEVRGKLSTILLFDFEWTDEGMTWDPSQYGGVASIMLDQNDVWKPAMTLSNPYSELFMLGSDVSFNVNFSPNGEASWEPAAITDSTCSVNTKYYPFDTQTCHIKFLVFSYDNSEVHLTIDNPDLDISSFEGSSTWKIKSTAIGAYIVANDTAFLDIAIVFERMYEFTVVTILLPMFVLASLNPLVFLLPAEEGERVGFSVTVLLSLTIFMSLLGSHIPGNSSPMSMMAYLLVILFIWSSIITVLAILSIRTFLKQKNNKPISAPARLLVRMYRLKIFRNRVKSKDENEFNDSTEKEKIEEMSIIEDDGVDWKDVSYAIDFFSCLFMYALMAIITLSFLATMT